MKKLLWIALLVLIGFNGFVYYTSGQIPVRDWSEQVARDGLVTTLKSFSFSRTFNQTKQALGNLVGDQMPAAASEKVQIYKWTDAKGVVHYHNKRVPGAVTITIDPNTNVLPMADAPKIAPVEKPALKQEQDQELQENREKIRRGMEARSGI